MRIWPIQTPTSSPLRLTRLSLLTQVRLVLRRCPFLPPQTRLDVSILASISSRPPEPRLPSSRDKRCCSVNSSSSNNNNININTINNNSNNITSNNNLHSKDKPPRLIRIGLRVNSTATWIRACRKRSPTYSNR